jgi:hypothetical protein
MIFLAIKIALFALGWWLGRIAIRAGERAGAFDHRWAGIGLHAALALIVALYWFPELRWAVENPGLVGRGLGILALTAVPVGGFVLFLRWAHRRAAARDDERT